MQRPAISHVALLLATVSVTCAQSLKLPEGKGKEATENVCGMCHGAELVLGRQETRESWAAIVDNMIQRGATGSEEEFFAVVDYLSANFSPTSPVTKINVNKATVKDLETALRLTPKEAAAIVQQRADKGDFKAVEELQKVPGVSVQRIEANRKRLSF